MIWWVALGSLFLTDGSTTAIKLQVAPRKFVAGVLNSQAHAFVQQSEVFNG